jgi:hypothetical protein
LWSGAALDKGGLGQAGMGVAAGDVDDDGLPDLVVTNFQRDTSTLYHNLGEFLFEDATEQVGLRAPTYDPLSWGVTLADFDLDGELEIYIANGHIYPQADQVPAAGTSYAQTNLLLAREGGRFVDVSRQAGPGLAVVESSRGLAVGDLEGDGDLDLVVANVDAPPTLLRNDTERRGAWLLVDVPGALRVVVEAGRRRFVRHRVIGASYLSASDPRFHFGLGPVTRIDRLTILWSDGRESRRADVVPNRLIKIQR